MFDEVFIGRLGKSVLDLFPVRVVGNCLDDGDQHALEFDVFPVTPDDPSVFIRLLDGHMSPGGGSGQDDSLFGIDSGLFHAANIPLSFPLVNQTRNDSGGLGEIGTNGLDEGGVFFGEVCADADEFVAQAGLAAAVANVVAQVVEQVIAQLN